MVNDASDIVDLKSVLMSQVSPYFSFLSNPNPIQISSSEVRGEDYTVDTENTPMTISSFNTFSPDVVLNAWSQAKKVLRNLPEKFLGGSVAFMVSKVNEQSQQFNRLKGSFNSSTVMTLVDLVLTGKLQQLIADELDMQDAKQAIGERLEQVFGDKGNSNIQLTDLLPSEFIKNATKVGAKISTVMSEIFEKQNPASKVFLQEPLNSQLTFGVGISKDILSCCRSLSGNECSEEVGVGAAFGSSLGLEFIIPLDGSSPSAEFAIGLGFEAEIAARTDIISGLKTGTFSCKFFGGRNSRGGWNFF